MSWLLKDAGVIIPPDYEGVLDEVDRRVEEPATVSSEEYKDLLNLLTVLVQEGVPNDVIKNTLRSAPMETIQDVGDAKAKLWTLACTDYGIPRRRLMDKMLSLETSE